MKNLMSVVGVLSATCMLAGAAPAAEQPKFDWTTAETARSSPFPTCTSYCAVINSDGTIARAHSNTTAAHLATGQYQVLFNSGTTQQKNITKCAFLATPGNPGFGGTGPDESVYVTGRAGTTNGVFVQIFDQAGAAVDGPFHLLVSC